MTEETTSYKGVTIDLSQAPQDRLNRAFGYLAAAMMKQPKSDFFREEEVPPKKVNRRNKRIGGTKEHD